MADCTQCGCEIDLEGEWVWSGQDRMHEHRSQCIKALETDRDEWIEQSNESRKLADMKTKDAAQYLMTKGFVPKERHEAVVKERDGARKHEEHLHSIFDELGIGMNAKGRMLLADRIRTAGEKIAAAKAPESEQATNCAVCGEHKPTPLRNDRMGGYVCLTCIDKELEKLQTS